MNKLAFFFPAEGPGGVQSIIIRLIKYAFEKKLPFIVLDYEDGYIASQIKAISLEAYAEHVVIIKCLSQCNFMSGYTFVAFNWQLNFAYLFQRKYKSNFIYWDVHSTSLNSLLNISVLGRCLFSFSTEQLICSLVNESRVLTIDQVSKNLLQRMSSSDDIDVTGIPITSSHQDLNFCLPAINDGLNVVYIGRAVDWKVIPFIYGLSKIIEKYSNLNVRCNVYTDCKAEFTRLLPDFYLDLNCHINFFDGFSMDDIIEKENGRVNLSIGMGTSQFELMIFGVPTLLIPAIIEPDLLTEFEPIWTHLLPPYIYGFDESTASVFNDINLPNKISLNDAGFIWNEQQLQVVNDSALKVLSLYSSENICHILLSRSNDASSKPSQAWLSISFKFFIFWTSFISLFKQILIRKKNN